MRSGHGDKNSKKHPKKGVGPFFKCGPLKIGKFRLVLTWDKKYDSFEQKKDITLKKFIFLINIQKFKKKNSIKKTV